MKLSLLAKLAPQATRRAPADDGRPPARWIEAGPDLSLDIADAFEDLDGWISNGGFFARRLEQGAMSLEATYDPTDNKLRLRSLHRLAPDVYERVRAAGFIWAPKQDLFVAPAWTPEREDLLLELCGTIEDEDTSLVDRAEERAERFEGYSESRNADAAQAKAAVDRIADNIPLGQPILIGHHSERRARKDVERIQNGMSRAVAMWKTANYWQARAKGAVAHAKYKELPDVRRRRIKGLEADRRRYERTRDDSNVFVKLWKKENLTREDAMKIANYDRAVGFGTWSALEKNETTAEAAREKALGAHAARIAGAERWITHLDLRLGYERAMLGDAPEPAKPARAKLAPLVNFPGEGYAHMTKEEWSRIHADYKGSRIVRGARVRTAVVKSQLTGVYLTDVKRVDPPLAGSDEPHWDAR